jgi:drug/metabolite transporter (DMT)-like permease
LGATLAVASGLAYNATAALQKHETVLAAVPARRLLPALLRRPLWLLTVALDLAAWVAQAAALAFAPIAMVVPLMSVGTVLLVVLGVRWLGERFGRVELAGVALVGIGVSVAAVAAVGIPPARAPLGVWPQLEVAAAAAAAALLASRSHSGVALGIAAGCLYAATAIYTKEVGDRLAVNGWHALLPLLSSPTPWLLAVFGVAALWLLQAGFQRANAAAVTAGMTAAESAGPVVAGFLLYHERWPSGAGGPLLAAGIAAAVLGSTVLAARHEALAKAPEVTPGRER